MENIIDETIKSLSEEYDKVLEEYQGLGKRLEALVAQHQIATEISSKFEYKKNSQTTGGTIIVKDKGK